MSRVVGQLESSPLQGDYLKGRPAQPFWLMLAFLFPKGENDGKLGADFLDFCCWYRLVCSPSGFAIIEGQRKEEAA
jgi:hypothetical protein